MQPTISVNFNLTNVFRFNTIFNVFQRGGWSFAILNVLHSEANYISNHDHCNHLNETNMLKQFRLKAFMHFKRS